MTKQSEFERGFQTAKKQIAAMIKKLHGDNWCRSSAWNGCVARDNLAHAIEKIEAPAPR